MEMKNAVAFTGHRPEQLIGVDEEELGHYIFEEVARCIDDGFDTFYCGAARGADIMCGECVADMREGSGLSVRLICVIPFRDQAAGWGDWWKMRYWQLRRDSDENILLSEEFSKGCYQARNRYMVDHADRIIAIYNGNGRGGTAYTVEYARRMGREIIIIDPKTMQKTVISARKE